MINYELALKLKKAGFPQELENGDLGYCVDCGETSDLHLTHDDNDEGGFVGNDYIHRIGDEHRLDGHNVMIKVPTLSELIEECGDRLGKLIRTKLGEMVNWNAIESYPNTLPINIAEPTPEEAVANLWLALNEK